ncbi:helix-turn-helix transcriptional regulator [uncultured Duncaniella sp.]|uniref:helix-turn-helix transcriptional regulator n=2 Tax=uncultured Duncaniella sp. TaxID=2768039 RepID=UPI0026325DFB|nr:helix-turn-helix transcriptional regulator [uncultured Duncaniella sp.]
MAMYERFLKYHNLPSGAVLGHLLKRAHLTQRELSERTGILPQRINDFIVGRRRISADVSLKIESALSIDIEGFFYIIQCHHDVYNAMNDRIKEVADTPDLSKIRKAIFWDTALESIDWRGNRRAVVQRVFEYGDEESVGEIIRFYGKAVVEECLAGIKDVRLKERRDKNAKMYMS